MLTGFVCFGDIYDICPEHGKVNKAHFLVLIYNGR